MLEIMVEGKKIWYRINEMIQCLYRKKKYFSGFKYRELSEMIWPHNHCYQNRNPDRV
jgi:hypothetical protein